jgi:CO dehydrogenase/acetyl-CoA synthase beta subunit
MDMPVGEEAEVEEEEEEEEEKEEEEKKFRQRVGKQQRGVYMFVFPSHTFFLRLSYNALYNAPFKP